MPAPTKLHCVWIIAGVTFVLLLLTAGIRAAPGALIVSLEQEFHWPHSIISFAVDANLLIYGLVGPFAAALMALLIGLGGRRAEAARDVVPAA
jgi:hypothetical protein